MTNDADNQNLENLLYDDHLHQTAGLIETGAIKEAKKRWSRFLNDNIYNIGWEIMLKYSTDCINQIPSYYLGFFFRGISLQFLNRFEESKADLELSLRLKPDHMQAKHYIAYVLAEL